MLRITVMNNPESLTFQLEGTLAGPWVRELEHCWRNTPGRPSKPVLRFDLSDVTFIDSAGKALLTAAYAEGAEFVATGCLMRAIVAQITGTGYPACNRPTKDQPHEEP